MNEPKLNPFEPRSPDGRAQWQIIFDYLAAEITSGRMEVDDVITHEELSAMIGGADHRGSIMTRVTLQLQIDLSRSLETVRHQGYKLVAGMRQLEQAGHLQARAQGTLVKARRVAETVDMGRLESHERTYADRMARGLNLLAQVAALHAEKLADHEEQLEDLKRSTTRARQETQDALDDLQARVSDLEQRGATFEADAKGDIRNVG